MRIVIIGSTGLIGSYLTKAAIDRGHSVVALSRRDRNQEIQNPLIQYAKWDGKTVETLIPLIEGADAIVNLAGESIGHGRWTPERKQLLMSSRITPFKAITAAWIIANQKPTVTVQASGLGHYGTGSGEKNENSPAGSDYLARFAQEWESSTNKLEDSGCRRIIIRSGAVLDKTQGVLPQLMLPFKLFVGGPIGSGKQIFSWIHIEDEVQAILFLMERQASSGVYNLTAPLPVSNATLGKTISKTTGLPYWMPVPGFALKAVLGEMSTLVLDGQYVLPSRLLSEGYQFRFSTIDAALLDLLKKR